MSRLIKIYESVIRYEEEAVSMEERIAEEVDRIIEGYEEQFNADELEELQDAMFSLALVAEHEGFLLGAKFFAKLIAECLS